MQAPSKGLEGKGFKNSFNFLQKSSLTFLAIADEVWIGCENKIFSAMSNN